MPELNSILKRIQEFNAPLLHDKVLLKYKIMAGNAFGFFRGTCHIFYEDLAKEHLPDSPPVWISGDLHLENFGSYKGDNRQVYFDINDFDESILAPASWELVRMLSSIFVSFNALNIDDKKALKMAHLFLKSYSKILQRGKERSIDSRTADGIVKKFLLAVKKRKLKELLGKRTIETRGKLRLIADGKKQEKLDRDLRKEIIANLNKWIKFKDECPYHYEVIDVAFRIAGTGSLGLKRYVALLRGTHDRDDYLLLDMKVARTSSIKAFSNLQQPVWESDAHRIVAIQDRMQDIPPALLSHIMFREESYVMQELQPLEDNINFKSIKHDYRDIYKVIDDMAILTASSQLRSSGREGSVLTDALIAFGKREDWQQPLIEYALKYSKKSISYYNEFLSLYKNQDT